MNLEQVSLFNIMVNFMNLEQLSLFNIIVDCNVNFDAFFPDLQQNYSFHMK